MNNAGYTSSPCRLKAVARQTFWLRRAKGSAAPNYTFLEMILNNFTLFWR